MNTQLNTLVNFPVLKVAHTAPSPSQRKDASPGVADFYHKENKLKYVKSVSCVTQLSCVKPVTNVASNLPVGGQTSKLLANLAGSGCQSESSSNPERGLHPPLSDLAQIDKVTNSHKLLCQSSQEPLPVRGIASAYRQKRSRASTKPKISGIFQPAFPGTETQQQMETDSRLQRCLFPNTHTGTVQEISQISHPRQVISVQGTTIRTVHGSH